MKKVLKVDGGLMREQSSGAVWKSRWPSSAPVPNKPTISVDIKQTLNQLMRDGLKSKKRQFVFNSLFRR